ncbi:ycsI [Symbiodinium sp. KB8]|nr:ycsI [Symbiodinium sp. KB8]
MRPMTPKQAEVAKEITARFPRVHGSPIHIGNAADLGILDLSKPDFGDAVTVKDGEVPVFWACGVTPQMAIENAKPPLAITHSPGHMFVTDVLNEDLVE